MRGERRKPPALSLVNIPAEITCQIIQDLSCRDFIALRRVSKAFHSYFTEENICLYAHRLYLAGSSEITRNYLKPYPTFPKLPYLEGETRTRSDFDAAYQRTRNWKLGQPTSVEIIDEVADGSVGCHNSILVSPQEGLLIYQKTRGMVVIKDLNRPTHAGVQTETTIDLQAQIGECIMMRAQSLVMREGESIRFRMNRGMLLVVGESHGHVDEPQQVLGARDESSGPENKSSWASSMLSWAPWSSPAPPVQSNIRHRVFQQPHSLCAVFSVRPQDRGRLVQKWVEEDSFMSAAALNEHYCISEFHLIEQKLEGVIFHPGHALDIQAPAPEHPAHRFTIRKKTAYPQLSTFDIAPDTKGKVFYLGFLPPPDRRPVVEVIAIPTKQADGTWTEPVVLKRVVLRTLAKHLEVSAALHKSYWLDFDDGFEVNKYTNVPENEKAKWKDGEDVVRLRLRGDFAIPGTQDKSQIVKLISWYITARPSPNLPSNIMRWREGENWLNPDLNSDTLEVSPWTDASGEINLDECYPAPTYYTSPNRPANIFRYLPTLPEGIDVDRAGLFQYGPQIWIRDEEENNKYLCGIYYSENGVDVTKPSPKITDANDSADFMFPFIPGKDDHDFVPPGRHLYAAYVTPLETGRTIKNKRMCDLIHAEMKAAGKKSTRGRTFVQALSECHRLAQGDDDDEEDKKLKSQELCKHIMAKGSKISKFTETLLLPGNDNSGLRGVLDWTDKRFLVYGKSGTHPSKGWVEATHSKQKTSSEKDEDKIVIVRFD
ncbi:hypothetical protein DFH27DRAFT_39192 [Peziza echinospora]|nr:hypothetical protein DFH27DRAFT_39192 [Peziza echinospora]